MSSTIPTPTDAGVASARRSWRPFAVIGIVAALAVGIGLAAATFLTSRATTAGSGSDYVPADAVLYLEMRLQPSDAQDEALRQLLGRFPPMEGLHLERPLSEQLVEMFDKGFADGGLDISWNTDIAPWTDGHAAIAMLELPEPPTNPEANPTEMAEEPSIVLMLGVTDADAARDAIDRILGEAGAPAFAETEHGGVTIRASEAEGVAYAITDDQLLVAPSGDDIITALDAADGGETLAGRDDVAALVASLPSDWLAFGSFDMGDVMAMAMEEAGAKATPEMAAMTELMEHQPTLGVFSVSATDDGLAFDAAGPPATGPFSVENERRGLASEVPADALFYTEGGNIGEALAASIGAATDVAAQDPEAAEGIATAEAALGAEMKELVAWIDDGALVAGWPQGGDPYAGLVLVPSDQDAAERRMEQLGTFARLATMDPSMGVSVEEGDVAGVSVTTLRWTGPEQGSEMMPLPVAGFSLQYAVTDSRVLIGIGETFVGRALGLNSADSLGSEPRYLDAVASLGGPDAAGVTWVDLAAVADAATAAMADFGVDLETDHGIEAWLAPLDRIVGASRLEGEVLVQRSVLLLR